MIVLRGMIFLLLIFCLFIVEISASRWLKGVNDGAKALGVRGPFSSLSNEILSHLFRWERQRLLLTTTPTSAATTASSLSQQLPQIQQHDFIICLPYRKASDWMTYSRIKGLDPILIYQSLTEDIVSYRVLLSTTQQEAIEKDQNSLVYTLFEPLPSFLKIDHAIHGILENTWAKMTNQPQSAATDPAFPRHPMVDYWENKEGGLIIDIHFSRPTSMAKRGSIVAKWRKDWRASGLKFRDFLNHLTSPKFPKITNKKEIPSSFHAWKTVGDTLMKSSKSVLEHCQVSDVLSLNTQFVGNRTNSLSVRSHKRGFHVHLSPSSSNVNCLVSLIGSILQEKEVLKVSLTQPIRLLNNNARPIVQSGSISSEIYSEAGLNGTGVIIGVADTGIDEFSCFFHDSEHGKVPRSNVDSPIFDLKYRKVIQYISYSGSNGDYASGHGSHVSGTLAGHCTTSSDQMNTYKGMASAAKLAFFDIGVNDPAEWLLVPEDLGAELYPAAYEAGARIYSNSWGGGYFIDMYSIDTDSFLYEHPDAAIFFAAGNNGFRGYYTVISPSIGKNVIAVGSSGSGHVSYQRLDYVSPFSSSGPSVDGRIKPDIVAPGYVIYSAKSRSENSESETCLVETKMGTSMATPVAAGNAALIRQYFVGSNGATSMWSKICNPSYRSCRDPSDFSGMLLKALVLQSGHQITAYDGGVVRGTISSVVPDVLQGYGRMELLSVLPLVSDKESTFSLYVDDSSSLPQLSQKSYRINVTSSSQALKLTLSWYDPPNDFFASKVLLHDLDLVLINPSGRTFYANLPAFTDADNPPLGSSRDELNSNEQITVLNPVVGVWTAHVQTKQLFESSSQRYALVITASGEVIEEDSISPLSWSSLDRCSSHGQSNSLEIDLSLWSRVDRNGWDSQDYVSIYSFNTSSEVAHNQFSDRAPYEYASSCLPSGYYEADLFLQSSSSHRGSQFAIPQCDVYLAPFAPKQKFYVDRPVDRGNGSAAAAFDRHACHSECSKGSRIEFPLQLSEYNGAGWTSSYYAVMSYETASHNSNPSYSFAKSMEWGREETQFACLPYSAQCYIVQLSYPSTDDEEYPGLDFLDGTLINKNGEVTALPCPFQVNKTVTMATFCTDEAIVKKGVDKAMVGRAEVTFHSQTAPVANLGQKGIDWSGYWSNYAHASVALGKCSVPLIYTSPAALDHNRGEQIFGFDYMNISCLSSCKGYPGADLMISNMSNTCSFLQSVYSLCDSFAIANNYCVRPTCAKACDEATWCYFGAGLATSCPDGKRWNGKDAKISSEISSQCLASSLSSGNSVSTDSDSDQKSSEGLHGATLAIVIGLGVLVLLIVLLVLGHSFWTYLQKRMLLSRGQRLPVHSEDRTLHDGRVSSEHMEIDDEEGRREPSDFIRDATAPKVKIHEELKQRSAKLFKSPGLFNRSPKNGHSNGFKDGQGQQYEMVPIQHDEDRETVETVNPVHKPLETSTDIKQINNAIVPLDTLPSAPPAPKSAEYELEDPEIGQHFTIAEDIDMEDDNDDHLREDQMTAVQMARAVLFENDLQDQSYTSAALPTISSLSPEPLPRERLETAGFGVDERGDLYHSLDEGKAGTKNIPSHNDLIGDHSDGSDRL